jgi:integrase
MTKRTNTATWLANQQRWQIKVQKDGVRRTFTSSKPGRTGQREANAKADAWLDTGILDQRRKVADVYRLFLEMKKDTTSYSNYRPMESRYRVQIEPIIGKKLVSRLTEQDLQEVINRAYKGGHLSKKSLENLRTDLTAFMKYCRKAKLLTLLPEDLTIPAAATTEEKTILQPEDFAKLFQSDQTTFYGKAVHDDLIHAYRLAVLTGMRPGELRGLQWGDIRGNRIELRRSINQYQEVTRGKNDNARRVVELSELALRELDAQSLENAPHGLSDSVFDIPSENYFRIRLQRYFEYNGIPYCTPYELRHTFVSIAKVLPAGLVKSIVGHSADMDTFGVYGHELQGDTARRVTALDELFSSLLQEKK